MSEYIIALYSNGALPALDGYIVTLEIAAYAQYCHSETERCYCGTDICSELNCDVFTQERCICNPQMRSDMNRYLFTLNGEVFTFRCAHSIKPTHLCSKLDGIMVYCDDEG